MNLTKWLGTQDPEVQGKVIKALTNLFDIESTNLEGDTFHNLDLNLGKLGQEGELFITLDEGFNLAGIFDGRE